ncbi:MAG: aminoglycoside phosphotransferase family protein [Verrucomicrobia bacterium]|nr:aminoglycoside phosphotransferase family protein [Verrucomicrobiota bacterium]
MYYGTTADHGSDGLLLMEEIKNARNIDQIRGLEWKDLRSAVLAIAQVHSHFWNSPTLKKAKGLPLHHYMRAHELKQNLPRFLRWANLSDENKDLFSTLPDRVPSVLARLKQCPFTLVHGDLRSDNIFFHGKKVRFIDWGLSFVGCSAFDLARLAGGSSRNPLTLMQHVELFNLWHRELLRRKVRNYPSHEAWQDYRDAVLLTLTIPVTNAPTLAKFSARGHKMAKVITTRFIFASHQLGIL